VIRRQGAGTQRRSICLALACCVHRIRSSAHPTYMHDARRAPSLPGGVKSREVLVAVVTAPFNRGPYRLRCGCCGLNPTCVPASAVGIRLTNSGGSRCPRHRRTASSDSFSNAAHLQSAPRAARNFYSSTDCSCARVCTSRARNSRTREVHQSALCPKCTQEIDVGNCFRCRACS
jgi:hypothetical protein